MLLFGCTKGRNNIQSCRKIKKKKVETAESRNFPDIRHRLLVDSWARQETTNEIYINL